ncbi:hypothetical protein AX761_22035 [Rhizobium sp. 58]|nr:hypothetical protein AX761_22035 [Rhizobium sp. 58]
MPTELAALEERTQALAMRIIALETMLTFALTNIAVNDKRIAKRMEGLMKELANEEFSGNVTAIFTTPEADAKDAIACLLISVSRSLHPPLNVPPALAGRAQRFRTD